MSQTIYQTNGKPLSQQAIYQQKLKQGVFGGPGGPTVGVNSNASDTAALLAASADLTVKPSYERIVAQEAHTAALAAKKETIQAWTRERDPQADAAASSARASSMASTTSSNYTVGTGVPSYNSDTLFRAANQNSSTTMTSRTDPAKDSKRSGLVTKSSSSTLNIGKISSVANKNSSKSLNSRFNPSLDYRSGLINQQQPSESFTASQVVNSTLLSAANSRANERLKSISSGGPQDFKAQAQAYANALQVAQKNSEERMKNHNAGLIDIGGGMTVSNSDIIRMASTIVQPVLKDLDSKALSQREADAAKQSKLSEWEEAHKKAKLEEAHQKSEHRVALERARNERIQKNEEKKRGEDEVYAQYEAERNEEVDQKVVELRDTEAKHEEEKQALLTEKKENQERIDAEEEELIASRKEELDNLQAEKDELLKPLLEELEVETANLEKLQGERDELSKEVSTAEELHEENETKVSELNEQIEALEQEIEESTKKLEELSANHESTSTEVEELQNTLDKHTKEAEVSHKDLDEKIEELTKQREDCRAEKVTKKQKILDLLDDTVKDEHKINKELPDHLRDDVDESKLRDVGSLFSFEHNHVEESKEEPPTPKHEETKPKPSKVVKQSPVDTSSKKEKKSGFRRFAKMFSSGERKGTSPTTRIKSSEEAKAIPKEAKEVKKEVKENPASVATQADDDEISLGQKKNQGGLFKEEI